MNPTLPEWSGYVIVLGLGALFAAFMNLVTFIQNKYFRYKSNQTDEFAAASRSVPIGLMVVSIVSSWTWSLTLLQSATETYNVGISGSYWYAVGGIIQVSIFSVIASKVKSNANLVTTFPEMGFLRFGTAGHLAFLWCGLVCNSIVSACILIGGGTVFSAVTGMNIYASFFLIPLVCAIYVYFGGLRATFISDATHTFILLVFLLVFVFYVFAESDVIGSPGRLWELLTELAKTEPIANNYHGSYLTFRSQGGGIFSFISIITGFGLVALDQAYWSRAIASVPLKTSKAYFIGATAWFVIPWAMGITLGLTARACSLFPDFPSLSASEVSAGLSSVASASYLLGKGGSVMILLMVFLSVTSSFSGELIAASTLLSYDVFKKYLRKNASDRQVLWASQGGVFLWAAYSGALASGFHAGGISMGWLFNFLGCATASGVFPVTLTFCWNKLNRAGAVLGSVLGMLLAIAAWLICCKCYMGEINLENLSDQWVSFCGNAAALFLGGALSVGCSLIKPDNFDWNKTRNATILRAEMEGAKVTSEEDPEASSKTEQEKSVDAAQADVLVSDSESASFAEDIPLEQLHAQFKKYLTLSLLLAFAISIAIPVPLSAAPYVYSKKFFTFVVAVMIIWLFFTFFVCIVLPLFESRKYLWRLAQKIAGKDLEVEESQ